MTNTGIPAPGKSGSRQRHVEADGRHTSQKTNMSCRRIGEQSDDTQGATQRMQTAHTHTRTHAHILILYNSTPALCNCRVAESARQATPPRNQGLLEATRTAFFFPLPLSTHILLLQSASFTFIILSPPSPPAVDPLKQT